MTEAPLPTDEPGIEAPAADSALAEAIVEPMSATRAGAASAPKPHFIRSSIIYSGLTMVSRIMGFVRDLAVTAAMGASATVAADAWNTALAFPNLFRRIFAEGAFAAAFVPAYAKSLAKDGEEVADILAADAMATLAAATIAITLVAELAMPWLMYVINPGYAHDPAKFKLAVLLTQITMPYLPCMAIYAHLAGVLNARGRFIASAFAPTLLNIGTLVAILPQHDPRSAAIAASWGAVAAGVAQAALLWWGVRKSGARVDFRLPRLTPEIRALIALAIPGAVAASATQINIFVSGVLASQTPGARSWLAVADRLYQLPLGLVGVAVGVALLPRLSTAVHDDDRIGAQSAMDEGITFSMALTLPAAAALIAMPYFLIDALFTRGEFHAQPDAHATARALFHYGWGVPAFVLQQLFSRAFFARGDTKTPMRFALISVAVNILLGVALFALLEHVLGPRRGFEGIAAATAAASWLNVIMMATTLGRRGAYLPSRAALTRLGKVLLASIILGVLLAIGSAIRMSHPHLPIRKELLLLIVVAIGGLAYFALLFATRAITVHELKRALRRRGKSAPAEEIEA